MKERIKKIIIIIAIPTNGVKGFFGLL